ncbi:hypothetical protein COCMIDRAFT_9151 [Bipolaris oryzae ATCC 44560]|uniref:Uncharacterized protein n=1 Tax=Bipolaris oryzae ATCC 44560 TaxID=930090 RepID=W6YU32_COCMI|nr:uncharacterized protein COCMIDRAFT_9151 [Bipolaris oryzae ATCC 44560]EUC41075.1 hypothetical protein COCMIDRAFT_9151 [Bipolaris oryzae ATCC 44560]
MAVTPTTVESSSEAHQQKLQELGYLNPPKIQGEDCEYAVNSHVPDKKPFQGHWLEAAEHEETARFVELFAINGDKLSIEEALVTVKTKQGDVDLNFSNIIVLAGDFYTNKEGYERYFPISNAEGFGTLINPKSSKAPLARFESAVQSMLQDSDGYLKKIRELITSEHHALEAATKFGDNTAVAYHEKLSYDGDHGHCHIPTDEEFTNMTKTGLTALSSMYAWIAYTNIDHFGDYAVMAYCVGHTSALQIARKARNETSDEAKMKMLRTAYIHEAFAAHFLTDLFSSGHLRAPRRAFHNPAYVSMVPHAVKKDAVWDFQCRYMHDDDSATGLLVRNKLGDQWIEYGDKQFMEPQASVNRARCMDCLKKSAAEVFRDGYKGDKPIEDWEKNKSWFKAMDLVPQPMTAIEPQNWKKEGWGGYDKHNPAPLWIALHDNATESKCTVRKDLNDHSNYGARRAQSPGDTGYGNTIQAADFVVKGQFPMQFSLDGLLSGGFIQIQDLDGNGSEGCCINFWTPAEVKFADKTQSTFTIHNRLIDQDIAPSREVLHWMPSGQRTGIIGFTYAAKADGSGDINMTETVYTSDLSPDGLSDGTCATFSTKNPWRMRVMGVRRATILSNIPAGFMLNLTRFIDGYFVAEREMVAVSQSENQLLVGVLGSSLVQSTLSLPKAPYGFVKPFRGAGASKQSILLARAGPKEDSEWVNLAKIDFDDAGNAKLVTADFDLELEAENDASVLVGDVMGWGHDQVVVVKPTPDDRTTVATYGQQSGSSDIVCVGLHQCDTALVSVLVGPLLTALVPSLPGSPNPAGHDLLQISRRKNGKKHVIAFHTHAASGDASDPLCNCVGSEVEDALASRSPEHFFSIKWMPVRVVGQARAVLEVFSWYGVLGVRVFTCPQTGDGGMGEWTLHGQFPHLGQTSIGAGLGCYGDWGHGFVAWAEENEWTDANTFRPVRKDDLSLGWWGMVWEDCDRPSVRGWDVERRPLR